MVGLCSSLVGLNCYVSLCIYGICTPFFDLAATVHVKTVRQQQQQQRTPLLELQIWDIRKRKVYLSNPDIKNIANKKLKQKFYYCNEQYNWYAGIIHSKTLFIDVHPDGTSSNQPDAVAYSS